MGPRLCDIKAMVKTCAISRHKADAGKQRVADEEEVADLRKKAEAGDAWAMHRLGIRLNLGHKGVTQDSAQALLWH